MPTFKVTGPDGHVYRVTAPEGATQEEIIARVQAAAAGATGQPKHAQRAHDVEESTLEFATRKGAGVLRGVRDIVDGGAQLVTRGLEAIAPAGSGFERWAREERENVERINAEGEAEYQAKYGKNAEGGWDGARLTGNVITGAAAVPVRAAQGASAVGRAWAGVKGGAAGAAVMPVADTENYWAEKGKDVALGGAAGGVLAPVAEVGLRAGGAIANQVVDKGRALAGRLSGEPVEHAAERMLRDAIPDYAALGARVQAQLREDVANALHSTGVVNPAAIRRLADFRAQGVEPRTSWVTRDPVAFTREENLAGIAGVGEPLQHQRQLLERSLVDTIEGTSSARGTAYELGEQAVAGVRQVEDAAKSKVDGLYAMFRDTAPDVQGNGVRFVNNLSTQLDEAMVGSMLPGDITARLQKIMAGEFPITPATLFQMRKAANALPPGNPSIAIFKRAIDDEMTAMADELGGSTPHMRVAKDLEQAARSTAKQRFDMHDAIPAMKAVAEGTLPPERFFSQYIVNGSVKEVANMWNALRDQAAKQAIRGMLTQHIRTAATGAARDDGAPFAQATFNKMLQQPGMPEKLRIVLGEQASKDLARVGRIAEAAKSHPAGSKVNTSNTSQAVINHVSSLLGATGKIPLAGPLIGDPLRRAAQGREVAAALRPGQAIAARSDQFAIDPELARRLAQLLAAPAGMAASSQ